MNLEAPSAPFSVRATHLPTVKEIVPLGAAAPLAGARFIDKLLERARQPIYDPELAYALSVLAGWSYADGRTLANKLKYYGLPLRYVDETQVRNAAMLIVASAFFLRSECGRVGILSFRGTVPNDVMNWFTDADVTMHPINGGRVHSGFYANVEALWDDVCDSLGKAMGVAPWTEGRGPDGNGQPPPEELGKMRPMEKLYITGHSLGAAMAVLAAARVAADASPVPRGYLAGVYTFGQPAVGDAAFAAQCEEQFGDILHRHVFGHDVVPSMPPRSSGPFVQFGEERIAKRCNEPWQKSTEPRKQAPLLVATLLFASASWVARRIDYLSRLHFPYSMDDHSPSNYISTSHAGLAGA
jgi:hypothetical protein